MKMVGVRVSASIPEALSKSISDEPSAEEWGQTMGALLEWAGYTREEAHWEEANKPAVVWANVALRLAYEMLPIFHSWRTQLRKNTGGRPRKDKTTGLFGLANPHVALMRVVDRQLEKAKKADARVSVLEACRALAAASTKELSARYHNLSGARLARLYYDGKKLDELLRGDIDRLKRGLASALESVRNATDRGPHSMD